jgi:hypothetical protein
MTVKETIYETIELIQRLKYKKKLGPEHIFELNIKLREIQKFTFDSSTSSGLKEILLRLSPLAYEEIFKLNELNSPLDLLPIHRFAGNPFRWTLNREQLQIRKYLMNLNFELETIHRRL